jgi:hypothetical protein
LDRGSHAAAIQRSNVFALSYKFDHLRSNATMKAIKNTWNTLTDSLRVVGHYSSHIAYPLLSYSIMLLATFTMMVPLLDRVLGIAHGDTPARIFLFLAVYFMYGVLYGVITFFNVALVKSIAGRLDGDDPGLAAGLMRASQHIGLIGVYTLVSATLGLLSFFARVLINPLFGMVIAPLVGDKLWVRWRQLSYNIPLQLAVPVVALDHPAPKKMFKRGEQLVKATWGERVKPAHSINLLALVVLLPIIVLFAMPTLQQGAAERNADLIRLGSRILLVSILTFTQVNALVNAIFALAAYRYATARKRDVVPGDPSYAEHAFVKPKKETGASAALTASTSDAPSVSANDSSN